MVFHRRLSDSKSSQLSRILLSILSVFNNVVVWMVSTRLLISKSPNPFNNPLVTVPKAPITIGIIVIFMFQFFQFPSKVQTLILLFTFFQFYSVVSLERKFHNFASSFFFFFFFFFFSIRSGLLAEISWSICMSNSHTSWCVLFSGTDAGLSIYYYYYYFE